MKFLIDMPISPAVAAWLVEKGHNAIHVSSVGLGCASDARILEKAMEESRIVITADLDFPRLLAISSESGPGIILFRGGNYSEDEMVALLKRTLAIVAEEELEKSIVVVDKTRVRKRHLPLRFNGR